MRIFLAALLLLTFVPVVTAEEAAEPQRPPIRGVFRPGIDEEPPSDEEVVRAWQKDRTSPPWRDGLLVVDRQNVRIVKEKIADHIDPPRKVPLVGPVQLHHSHYKCTLYCTSVIAVGWPVTLAVVTDEDKSDIIYIDHNHFHLVAEPATLPKRESREIPVVQERSLVEEVSGSKPGDQLLHLKAALAHLEKAGFEDPEIAKAAGIVGDLIDAKQERHEPQVVVVKLKVVEVNHLKLRDTGVDWPRLIGSNDNAFIAQCVESLLKKKLVQTISQPQIQTLSGRKAELEVGNQGNKLKAEFLPTVLSASKVRVQVACELTRTLPQPAVAPKPESPRVASHGVTTTLEIESGKPAFLGSTANGETTLVFVGTATVVPPREAKAPAKSDEKEAAIYR